MNKSLIDKNSKKKEVSAKLLPHHPCSCFFCENNLDKQHLLNNKGWEILKNKGFTKIDWNKNPYKKGDMNISSVIQEKRKEQVLHLVWEIENILESDKSPYEKKIALFNWLENLEVGDIPPKKKKRVDYILQAHLYSDLAKQSMEDYKKITAETFTKAE
ncbi:MAG: hypothetical protein MRERV_2c035 [Mycoplasmataceae bacterium RV_VA103A]|nr:MAG: hypothetical protein MRERV_2c035 [Mycoplasmataceae bacterium RV_VA103A]